MKNIDDLIDELYESEPVSTEAQIEEFEKTTVYKDLLREWSIWINDLRQLHENGQLQESSEYFRGAVNMLKQVKKTTGYIKDLLNAEEDESKDVQ